MWFSLINSIQTFTTEEPFIVMSLQSQGRAKDVLLPSFNSLDISYQIYAYERFVYLGY